MASVRTNKETGRLFFDFWYKGLRCREFTKLTDTAENQRKMEKMLKHIEAEITLGSFEYSKYFPNSKMLQKFESTKTDCASAGLEPSENDAPLFKEFAEEWLFENVVRWKRSYTANIRGILDNYLVKTFGEKKVSCITKGEILKFRSSLAKVTNGKRLSPDRINHIITPLRMILNDAADRHHFTTPFLGIKQLTVADSQVDPFPLKEVWQVINNVPKHFMDYYIVRFFSGMRTSEIDGLKWTYVDFDRREILIRETLVRGLIESTKTVGSARAIAMSGPVCEALKRQYRKTGAKSEYVFCTAKGTPFNYSNVTSRIWYPTLKKLKLKPRRPYQTRHTAATLWLASGENPEWIAKQMGHTSTKMLFTIYSRFVPNMTRMDGTAFESLISADAFLLREAL
ncbi:Arm DNA-binding domain-containing protein [Desulfuromonas thiophila]|uniref:Arm DNA-binding domain-containing protein n=1 Tax=Desulfuromonas thiophila TaxID=57664 RepID=UPI0024A80E21|nr:DUF3596 domain-containing protein [Desulfuromonas thiophila]